VKSIEFQKFIDLVTFDQNLIKVERDIIKMKEIEQSFVADAERLNEDFLDMKGAKDSARKAVDEKELYMKILDTEESEIKQKLDLVSNQKEYKSLEKELAVVNEKRLQHEQELIGLWNKFDILDKSYEAKRQVHDTLVNALQIQIQDNKKEIALLVGQVNKFESERLVKIEGVPQEWLDIYVNMKGRVSDPVVAVVGESCDACFYSVTSRDLQLLRQNKLLQCRDCYRLLYIE